MNRIYMDVTAALFFRSNVCVLFRLDISNIFSRSESRNINFETKKVRSNFLFPGKESAQISYVYRSLVCLTMIYSRLRKKNMEHDFPELRTRAKPRKVCSVNVCEM